MENRILTAAEVARLLKLNIDTVYELAQTGELHAAKIGGQWRFDGAAILQRFKSGGGDSQDERELSGRGRRR